MDPDLKAYLGRGNGITRAVFDGGVRGFNPRKR